MTLQGAGFSFDGRISSQAHVAARQQCDIRCEPGTTISLRVVAVGGDVGGVVTYLDESFGVGSIDHRVSGYLAVVFTGEAVAPPLDGPTAEVTAPFLFEGSSRLLAPRRYRQAR